MRYATEAMGIADNLARKAVRDAVSDSPGKPDSYGTDKGKVVVRAHYAGGEVTIRWFVGDRPSTMDAAVAAIATRMLSRLG